MALNTGEGLCSQPCELDNFFVLSSLNRVSAVLCGVEAQVTPQTLPAAEALHKAAELQENVIQGCVSLARETPCEGTLDTTEATALRCSLLAEYMAQIRHIPFSDSTTQHNQ